MGVSPAPLPAGGYLEEQSDLKILQKIETWTSFALPWVLRLTGRRITVSLRGLPSIFILGGTKSGSSSLTSILWQHPAHVPPMTSELMYLQRLPHFTANCEFDPWAAFFWGRYRNGHATYSLDGYRKFFPFRMRMRWRQHRLGNGFTSDCDPFNLYCPVAMRRIHAFADAPRFIISLRDPIDRAFSDYNMHATRGYPREERTFEQAIEDELTGTEERFRFRYLNQGIYEPHLRRWLEHFPRESFFILSAKDLFEDPTEIARQMFEFLDLPQPPSALDLSPRNVGKYATSMESATRRSLAEYFRSHNERLYALLGRNFGWGRCDE